MKKGRDIEQDISKRIDFIRKVLADANAGGIVFGNSGGKDSALAGILCKMACQNTLAVMMPCQAERNFAQDMQDAKELANKFKIQTKIVDLTQTKEALLGALNSDICDVASINIAPRLRMTALYAIAANENRLVAGTGNRSETYMGYFTKWGDGACDFNPIADLTVGEIYDFLHFLNAPKTIIDKAPSAGLFDGQTDENEMGVSYKSIDNFLFGREVSDKERQIIEQYHRRSNHKRKLPLVFGDE